jgi:hypothetical protein
MSIKHGTASHGGIKRDVTFDTKTGESKRYSRSADGYVDNGTRDSLRDAEKAGGRDIARGSRDHGDFRKRP